MVTWSELFQFTLVIIGVVSLVLTAVALVLKTRRKK